VLKKVNIHHEEHEEKQRKLWISPVLFKFLHACALKRYGAQA